ncbi:hypothetical protein LSAT2_007395 [Lamellibrachia satsuma]|nr:hypothetical protein LSAT2_007395 [Lamellibrachia satsuma]
MNPTLQTRAGSVTSRVNTSYEITHYCRQTTHVTAPCLPVRMSMVRASCLLPLALLAACLSDTNAGKIYDTCAVNADCPYAHGNCITPDECKLGMCYCVHGYSPVDNVCKDLKTIDETCDDSTDTCYSGTCTGNRCVCDSRRPPSEDKKSCGREYENLHQPAGV